MLHGAGQMRMLCALALQRIAAALRALTSDAVVDGDDGNVPNLAECARDDCTGLQRSAHARALGVRDGGKVLGLALGFGESRVHEREDPLLVVLAGLSREEALPWRRDIGVPRVGEE